MGADDALAILEALAARRVDACVGGGWAVDALLGEETRPHADLDLWIAATTFDAAVAAFAHAGIDRLYPWGDDRPWNFVLHDGAHRRVDLHLYEPVAGGMLHYGGFETGETFPAAALDGTGRIGRRAVRCEAASWSVRWHTGYPVRPEDRHDVPLLCDRFALPRPPGFE